jgi:hypothetical protein
MESHHGLQTAHWGQEPSGGAPTFLSAWASAEVLADKNVGAPKARFMERVSGNPEGMVPPRRGEVLARKAIPCATGWAAKAGPIESPRTPAALAVVSRHATASGVNTP